VTIRGKLFTAIVVAIAGLALTVGVGIWAMSRLGDRFDKVQATSDAQALALQLKFDITDFNGWQTAYGYDNGKSRPLYLAAFDRFEGNLAHAEAELTRPGETRALESIDSATTDFARLDARAWTALQAGRTGEVRRLFLGPEISNFQRAASAAQELADFEHAQASVEDQAFRDARSDAFRLLVGASIVSALLIVILLVAALDLARMAERMLEGPGTEPPPS
jgi:hypothetical protein